MQHSLLASPSATRAVLERHGLSPKKSFGQNFLVDDNIIGAILKLADVQSDDIIVEVGPGIGTLTSALLANCAGVVAIERDPDMVEVLADTIGEALSLKAFEISGTSETSKAFDASCAARCFLVNKDALDITKADLAFGSTATGKLFPNKLVANLPYAAAATIVLDHFERFDFLESMTVMVQKEVADRMRAKPATKDYGAYTVKLSLYATPGDSFNVAPDCFMPAPHVESTVIRLDRCGFEQSVFTANVSVAGLPAVLAAPAVSATLSSPAAIIKWAAICADAAFFARRKTIANSMRQYFAAHADLGVTKPQIDMALESAGIDPKVRGETLERERFIELAAYLRNSTV